MTYPIFDNSLSTRMCIVNIYVYNGCDYDSDPLEIVPQKIILVSRYFLIGYRPK